MKSIYFSIVMLFAINTTMQAQIKLGAIGGLTFCNQKVVSNTYNLDASKKTNIGLHIGVTSDIPLSYHFSFQPELYYSAQNSSFQQNVPLLNNYNTFNLGYLKMPLCLSYLINFEKMFWYFGAGPYAARIIHNTASFVQNDVRLNAGSLRVGNDMESQITPWDLGLKFKTGFLLKYGIGMGVYYERSLKDVNPQLIQTYNNCYGISINYLFNITNTDAYSRYPNDYNF